MDDKQCEFHSQKIAELEQKLNHNELKLVEINSDVKHIKERIDNGLSTTITKIWDKMNDLAPDVKESKEWTNRLKQAFFWIAVIAVGGGVVKIFMDNLLGG